MNARRHTHAVLSMNRRAVLGAAGTAGVLLGGAMRAVHGQGESSDLIRVGVIGAGGRGSGALKQALSVPGSNVRFTAVADAFRDRIDGALNAVRDLGDRVDVPEDRRFDGLDGWKRVLDHCDLVILATPPGFRPFHFQAAIDAGKHVFMEKPVCVDAFGARLCLETAARADARGLKVVVGLQRRYQASYREALARVREGLIGDIIGGQVYWNGSGIWYRNRKPNQTEMQFQVHNWYHFRWLCGDHIVEQHVHNIAPDPYQVEHDELQDAIRRNAPLNNAVYGATSSFSAVLGRLATYTGKRWTYDEALALDDRSMPETLAWDADPPVMPDAHGDYPPPMPATFKVRPTTKPAAS